jgi:hypothetical protein
MFAVSGTWRSRAAFSKSNHARSKERMCRFIFILV